MPLVLGRGPSINEFARNRLKDCAKQNFTFAVNNAAFDFACDVVVALDPQWIKDNRAKLLKKGKPIITRKWDCLGGLGLDLIELPNEIVEFARLSGMAAVKISDGMAKRLHSYSFVLGIDATDKHYDRVETACQPISEVVKLVDYDKLLCHHTVNLGLGSKIACWPKSIYLPFGDKPSDADKLWGTMYLRSCAKELIMEGMVK